MKFHYTNLGTCHEATGVVVIDVIRAFTNAAVAFSRGAKEIYPVSGVEEALQLKSQIQTRLFAARSADYLQKVSTSATPRRKLTRLI